VVEAAGAVAEVVVAAEAAAVAEEAELGTLQ